MREFKAVLNTVPSKEDFQVVIHADKKPLNEHGGLYNAPAANEVAIVIVG